jgi:hypothetical protein
MDQSATLLLYRRAASRLCLLMLGFGLFSGTLAQPVVNPDRILSNDIRSVRLHLNGDPLSMPICRLNGGDRLELHFDDLTATVRSYYYTFQLCDFNWMPVNLSTFDYIKGFTQQRITTYRISTQSFTRYTHYQALIPDPQCMPSRSGNYLLKVFLDGDTSKTVFTRGMLVVDNRATVNVQMMQPFTPSLFRTHQRLRFTVNIDKLNAFNASQQIKVRVLQNHRWDNAQGSLPPTFVRGNSLEYNNEASFVFPGGKEWRWLDLRSFRLLSDRIDSAANGKTTFNLYVKPDTDRSQQKYVYFQDLNGLYQVVTIDNVNPYWQTDYATVNFRYFPPDGRAYEGKDLFLFGQLTDYRPSAQSLMRYNSDSGYYSGQLYLKQGFYNYAYALADKKNPAASFDLLEGNYWETENSYTVLVYYRGFTDQSDQLIGIGRITTRFDRPGISF